MSNNAAELRRVMREHKMSRKEAAAMCGVSIHTVDAWLLPPHAKAHRNMRDKELRHLELEIRARTN